MNKRELKSLIKDLIEEARDYSKVTSEYDEVFDYALSLPSGYNAIDHFIFQDEWIGLKGLDVLKLNRFVKKTTGMSTRRLFKSFISGSDDLISLEAKLNKKEFSDRKENTSDYETPKSKIQSWVNEYSEINDANDLEDMLSDLLNDMFDKVNRLAKSSGPYLEGNYKVKLLPEMLDTINEAEVIVNEYEKLDNDYTRNSFDREVKNLNNLKQMYNNFKDQ